MKGIFIYNKRIDSNAVTGIDKKVMWQVEALSNEGLECELVQLYDTFHSKVEKALAIGVARLPHGNAMPRIEWRDNYRGIDFLYFRRPDAVSPAWLQLLRKIKEENPEVKIIMEIPNYPYDDELGFKTINKPLLWKDRIFREKLKQYVDKIAVQNDVSSIFGIQTIQFVNGIKFDDILIREPVERNDEVINICAVASLEPWQGYERVIIGLKQYIENGGKRTIDINIIGSGSEMEMYKRLIEENGLTDHIHMRGRLSGDGLLPYYNSADLALDAFGRYKTGNMLSTSLKSREYLAKGLPIITGCKTDILNRPFPYYMECDNDDSPVDFSELVRFFDSIYGTGKKRSDVASDVRKYGRKICDISVMIKPIRDFLADH